MKLALSILSGAVLALPLAAAEPVVKPDQLPRVPPTPPSLAVATLAVRPGFHAELMAAEPLVLDPVALAFDENERLFAVEMRDYSERRDEHLGRVRMLEDTNHDGRFDRATVYVEGLSWPTGVACWDGGIFVIAAPDLLFFKDTNGDGVADVRRIVATGFGNLAPKLNVQALPNSLTWGLDNRIHGALGGNPTRLTNLMVRSAPPLELRGRDFSFDPRTGDFRAESGGGQYGIAFDDAGHKFTCSNSRHLIEVMYDARDAGISAVHPLPPAAADIAVDGPSAEVFRLSPDEPWRVLRTRWRVEGMVPGPIEGGGRPSGYFTAATGLTIYRGDAWPDAIHGDAFVADCGSNLIHRKKLSPEGPGYLGERPAAERRREFLASTDNWFRPVQLINAPDGQLWFADFYREVIEHPWSLPESLKQHLDLNAGNDRGRIYRIVADPPRPGYTRTDDDRQLGAKSSAALVALLAHPNGWHRDTAARLLYARQDQSIVPNLRVLATNSVPLGRLHALSVLHGLGALELADLETAFADSDAHVREHVLRLCAERFAGHPPAGLATQLRGLATDPSPFVRFQLAFTLARLGLPPGATALAELARRAEGDPWLQDAVLAIAGNDADNLFTELWRGAHEDNALRQRPVNEMFLAELARLIARRGDTNEITRMILRLSLPPFTSYYLPVGIGFGEALRQQGRSLTTVDPERRLNGYLLSAAQNMLLPSQPEQTRRRAIAVLGLSGQMRFTGPLLQLLGATQPPEISQAALTALGRLNPPTLFTNLSGVWPLMRVETRRGAVQLILARPGGVDRALRMLEARKMARSDFTAADVAALRANPDSKVRARVDKIFGQASPRREIIASYQPSLTLTGDAANGQQLFRDRCASCHRFRGEGLSVGPDLASVAGNGKEKLLESILDPDREIAPAYAAVTIEARTGETFTGVVAAETESSVTLRLAGTGEALLPRQQILSLTRLKTSLMPEGMEAGLSRQDMADLLAFLTVGGNLSPARPSANPPP